MNNPDPFMRGVESRVLEYRQALRQQRDAQTAMDDAKAGYLAAKQEFVAAAARAGQCSMELRRHAADGIAVPSDSLAGERA